MKLIELSLADKDNYNRFVAASPSGSFLQSWEWGQWQETLGRPAVRYWVLDDSGKQTASLQLIKMPLPFGKHYVYAPYGPVLADGESYKLQVESDKLIQELQRKFSDAVFIRIEPKAAFNFQLLTLNSRIQKSANIQPAKTLVVDLQKTELELLGQMHQKTRYNIKLAQKRGVEIISDLAIVPGHGLYLKEALDLIVQTSGRQSFVSFPRDYYQKFLDFFAMHNQSSAVKVYVYKALFNRQLLSAALMIDFGDTRTYLFGGSADHNREVMAPHLLHFAAIMDAKKNNLKFYDFWGVETASGETPGFVRFKMGFSPEGLGIKHYPGAYDCFNNTILYHGYHALRKINRALLNIKSTIKK